MQCEAAQACRRHQTVTLMHLAYVTLHWEQSRVDQLICSNCCRSARYDRIVEKIVERSILTRPWNLNLRRAPSVYNISSGQKTKQSYMYRVRAL